MRLIEIVRPGLQATVQDLGRPGLGHLGVPEAGAMDPASLRLANRIVGNDERAAGLELLLGGFAVRFTHDALFCLAGAHCPSRLDGRSVPQHAWVRAEAGQCLVGDYPVVGLRTYLAVRGGLEVPSVLGSRSTDTLSGLGPSPLRAGDQVPVGPDPAGPPRQSDVVVAPSVRAGGEVLARFRWGPRDDWFTPQTQALLPATRWRISHETDRVAARLLGGRLPAGDARQLPTEGLCLGSIQVPPSGQPIIHLANHPPTGGYPVIGVVDPTDLVRIAQSSPGTVVWLTPRQR